MQRHFRGWEDCDVRTESLWTGSESPQFRHFVSLTVERCADDVILASSHGVLRRWLPIRGRRTR
jgi:hypothetical protein